MELSVVYGWAPDLIGPTMQLKNSFDGKGLLSLLLKYTNICGQKIDGGSKLVTTVHYIEEGG